MTMVKAKTTSGHTPTASGPPFQPDHPCHNCQVWGHAWGKCPQKNVCLRCPAGTPPHPYWDSEKCVHRKKFNRTHYDAKPKAKANSAVVDYASDMAALRLENEQLKARR